MAILVIAEHNNVSLHASTLNTVSAASRIASLTSSEIHVLVGGAACRAVAEAAARIAGVAKVKLADLPHLGDMTAESHAALIVAEVTNGTTAYSHILSPATSHGKNTLPRVAALLDVAQISEIIAVEDVDTFVRPFYAGNVLVTVKSSDVTKVITVRTTGFDAAISEGGTAVIEDTSATPDAKQPRLISRELSKSTRPELGAAKVIVSGGRGLGNGENFQSVLGPLADKLGAALGATRAAVDAGFVPNDYQVGQTGKIVAPQLYIAVGISGAFQHLAGMKDSKVIVAINKDPDAPIFQIADYGLVADLFTAVPEFTAAL